MANKRTIQDQQLKENTYVIVEGQLEFSRLASHIAGDELIRDQQNKAKNQMNIIDRPYTTVTLIDPKIVPKAQDGTLSVEEQYIQERFYTTQRDPSHLHYNINNTSPNLSRISAPFQGNVQDQRELVLKQELANGLTVRLLLRIYKPKKFNRKGVALDCVMLMEEPKYYNNSRFESELQARGMTFKPMDDSERERLRKEVEANVSQTEQATPVPKNDPFTNTPNTTPASAPAFTPAPAAPVVPTAPVQAPTPAPQAPAAAPMNTRVCSVCGHAVPANLNFCGNCGHRVDTTTAPSDPDVGIVYNADSTDRNY